ncbi:hypothetical protein ACQPZ8_01655 [Actinomadura nitritigenes]|uniref:hypothetical protein n=1 Tax=Actinomadura nitritigenes TaxID=134602 RepID=UPI003D8D3971
MTHPTPGGGSGLAQGLRRGGWTNMAWPEDPYGSGQTLRTKPRLLTATVTCSANHAQQRVPLAHAVVYLRLHRTKAIDATEGLAFGFRAAAALAPDETAELVRLADLDLLRARRLAQVLAGHCLELDLNVLQAATTTARTGAPQGDTEFGRGLRALAAEWPGRGGRGRSETFYFDLGHDLAPEMTHGPGGHGSERAEHLWRHAKAAGLRLGGTSRAAEPQYTLDTIVDRADAWEASQERLKEWLAACATEHALVCALVAARHLGLYAWDGELDVAAALATNVGDCFPTQQFQETAPA